MELRKCKCGTVANTEEELELFAKASNCTYGRRNMCKACMSKSVRKTQGYLEPKKCAPIGTYTNAAEQTIYRRYGLSREEHEAYLDAVDNKCEICSRADRKLVIDHCHDTGKVRGILCQQCNSGIGFLGDTVDNIRNAVTYFENL